MIETNRLLIRQWKDTDIPHFIALNRDAEVMRYFPDLYTEQKTREFIDIFKQRIASQGWGFWAVEEKTTSNFIGSVGLNAVPSELPIPQTHEVGWRLAKQHWGSGYATEAASASLDYAFSELGLNEVAAFTPVGNLQSRRVMEKLGMGIQPDTFNHPRVPESSGLSTHVLYSIEKTDIRATLPIQNVIELLDKNDLPTLDLQQSNRIRLYCLQDDDGPVGTVGLEVYGQHALIRSLAVSTRARGTGAGKKLTGFAEDQASTFGVKSLYLLTNSAEQFFTHRDYRVIERTAAPSSISGTVQFSQLCPDTAVLMIKEL